MKTLTKEDFDKLPYIVAVDFDDTLAETNFPDIIRPNLDLIEKLKKQRAQGTKIILWTSRDGYELVRAVHYCNKHGLNFDAVNENIQEVKDLTGNDTRKVYANLYIDDKARIPKFPKKKG
jgi:hydroxymethylpyrimidine pyrophosphatase-like HAD family hydrolase